MDAAAANIHTLPGVSAIKFSIVLCIKTQNFMDLWPFISRWPALSKTHSGRRARQAPQPCAGRRKGEGGLWNARWDAPRLELRLRYQLKWLLKKNLPASDAAPDRCRGAGPLSHPLHPRAAQPPMTRVTPRPSLLLTPIQSYLLPVRPSPPPSASQLRHLPSSDPHSPPPFAHPWLAASDTF